MSLCYYVHDFYFKLVNKQSLALTDMRKLANCGCTIVHKFAQFF